MGVNGTKLEHPDVARELLLELDEMDALPLATAAAIMGHKPTSEVPEAAMLRCLSRLVELGFVEVSDASLLENVIWERGHPLFPRLAAGLALPNTPSYSAEVAEVQIILTKRGRGFFRK